MSKFELEESPRKVRRIKKRRVQSRRTRTKIKSQTSHKKYLIGFLLSLSLLIYIIIPKHFFVLRPTPSYLSKEDINPYQEPIQKKITKEEEEYIIDDRLIQGHIIKIKPVAEFEITARVVSKRYYNDNWDGELMPVDLAVTWGELAKDEKHKFMTYHHSNRYFNWKYQMDLNLSREYVISHSANIHLIAKKKNIEQALISAKIDELIYLKGFLIDIYGPNNDIRRSSIVRNDLGNGACENLYVEKLAIGNEVFE